MSGKNGDLNTGGKNPNEFNVAVSASAITAILLVSGFCWLVYYVCHPSKRHGSRGGNNVRKVRAHSITSGASVPGDSHGHYYAPRNPNTYAVPAQGEASRSQSPFPSVFDLPMKNLPMIITDDGYGCLQGGNPPPYPGQLNEVVCYPHSPTKAPLPPPYSA